MLEHKQFSDVPVGGVIYFATRIDAAPFLKQDAESCIAIKVSDSGKITPDGVPMTFTRPKETGVWHYTRGCYETPPSTAVVPICTGT